MLYCNILSNIIQYWYLMLGWDLSWITIIICIGYNMLMIYCVFIIVIHDSTFVRNIMLRCFNNWLYQLFFYVWVCMVMIITKEQNVIIAKLKKWIYGMTCKIWDLCVIGGELWWVFFLLVSVWCSCYMTYMLL